MFLLFEKVNVASKMLLLESISKEMGFWPFIQDYVKDAAILPVLSLKQSHHFQQLKVIINLTEFILAKTNNMIDMKLKYNKSYPAPSL